MRPLHDLSLEAVGAALDGVLSREGRRNLPRYLPEVPHRQLIPDLPLQQCLQNVGRFLLYQ